MKTAKPARAILAGAPGAVIYRGPSKLDGAAIVAIATGFNRTKNAKTGRMLQTWILRENESPMESSRTGADASICGDCPLRGFANPNPRGIAKGRACYVNLAQAPLAVWKAYRAGSYFDATKAPRGTVSALCAGRVVRLGSYGDPAAIPAGVWRDALRFAVSHTGYSHQWRDMKQGAAKALRPLVMASVENETDAALAHAQGWRTFRVRPAGAPILANEITCPASDEGGNRTTCEKCRLCRGALIRARNVTIVAHGFAGRHLIK